MTDATGSRLVYLKQVTTACDRTGESIPLKDLKKWEGEGINVSFDRKSLDNCVQGHCLLLKGATCQSGYLLDLFKYLTW